MRAKGGGTSQAPGAHITPRVRFVMAFPFEGSRSSEHEPTDQGSRVTSGELRAARSFLQQALSRLDEADSVRSGLASSPGPTSSGSTSNAPICDRPGNSQWSCSSGHSQRRFGSQRPGFVPGRGCCPSWMAERRTAFRRTGVNKSKKVKLSMWDREFICLAYTAQTTPPSPMDKAELIRAGLRPRKLSFFEFGDSNEFHEMIISAFPKLMEGGGYELLRTVPNNNKELYVIPPPHGGFTVEYLKSIVSQAKVYIRPLQKNLSLDAPLLDITLVLKCVSCIA